MSYRADKLSNNKFTIFSIGWYNEHSIILFSSKCCVQYLTCYGALDGEVQHTILRLPVRGLYGLGHGLKVHEHGGVVDGWRTDGVVGQTTEYPTVFCADISDLIQTALQSKHGMP